ncbi:MAG TPA: alpha/beta fold hydrolase, partial [Thermoanaerobaculia bacterium]|nr:alpha/beta fold hydrolase [Thermoanaerobaculia bacterium]
RQRAALAESSRRLSAAKQELLARRLRGQAPTARAAAAVLARRPTGGAGAAAAARRPAAPAILVKLQEGARGRLPFFCVHAIGGAVFSYGELARLLGPEQPFYGLQSPGLESGVALDDLVALAAQYAAAVEAAHPQSQGPYLLGGWSFGGVVAFEMARQLRARGIEMGLLALLDAWSPAALSVSTSRSEAELLRLFLRDQAGLQGRPAAWLEEIADLEDLDQRNEEASKAAVGRLLARAREAGLLRADLRPEQAQRLLGVYRANLRALSAYRPPAYAGRLILFRPAAAPADPGDRRAANGWEAAEIVVEEVSGDHYTMLAPPQVEVLAARLGAAIARVASKRQEAEAVR